MRVMITERLKEVGKSLHSVVLRRKLLPTLVRRRKLLHPVVLGGKLFRSVVLRRKRLSFLLRIRVFD